MKSYSFSKVSARGYLTEADYNNKYIFTDDLKQIINVSGRPLEKPLSFFRERDLIARNMPLTDKDGDMGFDTLLKAVRYLLFWDRRDKRSIVCCAFGVNRSRTVIEAFHYARMAFPTSTAACICMQGTKKQRSLYHLTGMTTSVR